MKQELGICPKCRKRTLAHFHNSRVVGVTPCRNHVLRQLHEGNNCGICDFHECKIETVDHNNKVLSRQV